MIGLDSRRRVWPERTVLYRMVQQHLESWLAARREADPDGVPIPRHVERELRGYLECGILAFGFARARCGAWPRPPPIWSSTYSRRCRRASGW